jgi:hypothetical protein
MATNKNILDSVLQAPGSLANRALQGVANTAQNEDGPTGQVSRGIVNFLSGEETVKNIEKLDKPYRTFVARPMSTFLQTVKDVGQDGLTPRQTWDRAWERSKNGVTIGQASVGLVARYTPGQQGADKINWSDKMQVEGYFKKDNTAAERISGAIDGTMNFFFDPLVFIGKGAKLLRLGAMGVRGTEIKGPLKFGRTNLGTLVNEADAAKAGEKNSVSIVVDRIEKNIGDFTKLESIPIVANSQNPTAVSRALNEAYETGGREEIFEVIKAGLGDETAISRIETQDSILSQSLYDIKGRISSIENQLNGVPSKTPLKNNPKLTPKQLKNLEANKEKLVAEQELKRKRLDALRTVVSKEDEGGIVGKVGSELAWSRRKKVEYLRNKIGEINGYGWFTDYDAAADSRIASAMHKFDPEAMSGTKFRALRTVGYFGRNYKPREIPAGSVTIAGEVGDFANKEFRARLTSAAPEAGFSAEQQVKYYNEFSAIKTDTGRFAYLERFEEQALTATLMRRVDTSGMTKEQLKVLNETFLYIARDIGNSKKAKLKEIINDQQYVNVDSRSGEAYIVKDVRDAVTRLSARIAQLAGREVVDADVTAAKNILSGTPQFQSQVPNIHYGVDFKKISEILSDEKTLISGIASVIRDRPDVKSAEIKSIIDKAKTSRNTGVAQGAKEAVGELWHETIIDGYEYLQNYIWKPFVLLSLRYTSRNVLEGWARSLASFADMTTHQGLSLRTLVSGFDIPDMVESKLENVRNSVQHRREYKGLLGTGGARAQLVSARAQKLENELTIGRNFGALPEDTPQNIVRKIRNRYTEEGEHFLKVSQDVLSTSIEMSRQQFDSIGKYRGSLQVTSKAKEISELGKDIFSIPDSEEISSAFLNAMRDGDYALGYKIAINSDAEIIFNTLELITNQADDALVKINKIASASLLNRTPKLKLQVETIQETIELIKQNSDVTKMAFDSANRQSIMKNYNDALEVSPAKPEKRRAFSTGRVKISKNATMDAAMAKTMRYETVSASQSTSISVLNSRRNALTKLSSVGKKQRVVEPEEDIWTAAHSEYVNNIIYNDDASRKIIELSVTARDAKNPYVQAELKAQIANLKSKKKANKETLSKKEIDDFTADFLKGDYGDNEIKLMLIDWVKTSDSLKWRNEMRLTLNEYKKQGSEGLQWSDIFETNFAETHKYLPLEGPSKESLKSLREDLIANKFDDTKSALIPQGYREPVYANVEAGPNRSLGNLYRNAVGNLFHILATMPEDFAVRHPFYNAVYKAEGERLAKQFAKQRVDVSTRTKEIQNAAHAAALKAVNDRLYTVERHTNIGQLSRFIEPFYMAKQNTVRFWVPTIVRNPEIAVRFVQFFTLPYKLGTVYDREDNYKVVNQIGHPWNAKGKVMLFEYPQWMVDKFFAGDSRARVQVPLSGFDVVFQGQPIGVPQIGSPIASAFLGITMRNMIGKPWDPSKFLEKNGIADLDTVMSYIQPYYEATRGENLRQQVTGAFGSGSVAMESLLIAVGGQAGMFADTAGGQKFYNRFRAIEADKLAALLEDDVPITGAILERTREEALALATKSFYAEAFTNGLPLVSTTRYKTYYEVYGEPRLRALRDRFGYDLGTARYVEEIDKTQGQYIANLITDSMVDNRFGFNSSEATLSGIYPNQELLNRADTVVGDTSLIGSLFNQGDFVEDRSDMASDILFNIRVNGKPIKYSSDDGFTAAEDLQVRAGNKDYYAGIEIIEKKARDAGLKKGTKAYEEEFGAWKDNWESVIAERYPVWGARDKKIRQNRVEKNVAAASLIVFDNNFSKTVGVNSPISQAVKEYLIGRQELIIMFEEAKQESGRTTLEAADNAYIAEMRDNFVSILETRYPGFQRVYDIYFNNDPLTPITQYETGYGFN